MRYLIYPCALMAAAGLGACSNLASPILSPLQHDGYITSTGVHQLFPEDQVEKINLISLLDPGSPVPDGDVESAGANPALIRAFASFYKISDPPQNLRRNRVQDSIRMSADARCGTYLKYLSRVEKTQSQFFDGASTLLSGFGTVARVASTGQLLSGLSTMTKGVGSEIKHSYFGSIGAEVIAPSIAVSRRERWTDILNKQKLDINAYSVEAAVADAIEYHNSCTLVEGLEKAKALIQAASK
jgi:hypothetical protein